MNPLHLVKFATLLAIFVSKVTIPIAFAQDSVQIASLDFCADQYVLALADQAQIRTLSPEADGEYSYRRKQAETVIKYRPRAETLLMMKPTFVVRQWGGSATLLQQLQRHGISTLQLNYVNNFDGITNNIDLVANALGQTDKGQAAQKAIQETRQQLAKNATDLHHIRALYVTPGGVTAANNTMIDTIIKEAGLVNISSLSGQQGWPALSAEALVLNPPDVIITGFFDSRLEASGNWSAARHPIFQKLFAQIPTIAMPLDLISCPGPDSILAAEFLQQQILALFPERGEQ